MRPGRFLAVVGALASLSCGREPVAAPPRVPGIFATVNPPSPTAKVGNAPLWRVRVTDSAGAPIAGVLVSFAPVVGHGSVTRPAVRTDEDGNASSGLRVGLVTGPYQFRAVTQGLSPLTSPVITATPDGMRAITPSARSVRFAVGSDSAIVAFTPTDSFGNAVAPQPGTQVALASRNPALVSVTNASPTVAYIRAVSRPGQTWVVGGYDGYIDSVQVSVLDATATPCTFVASPVALAVGESLTSEGSLAGCMKTATNAEFVVVAHYNTPIANAMATSSMNGVGVVIPAPYPASALLSRGEPADVPIDPTFEQGLRERERQIESRAADARAWYRSLSSQPALVAQPREGDIVSVNVNANDFCANPAFVTMRVAAVSDAAVILHDVENPAGGFTDAEYEAIARTVDTLVYPVDTAAFGAPTDIDRNGRIAIVYTKAVNALTPRTSTTVTLGFFYSRDLLPRTSASSSCPGSNAGEVFYVLVPDPDAVFSAARTKDFVQRITLGTIAHELQHLINASRRLYVNEAHVVGEEVWLNEGISHIAEELVFYRASGRAPRQNIGAAELSDAAIRAAFDQYQSGNFRRYVEYLRIPDQGSPVAGNNMLSTRGAAWAFLRYAADRVGPTDGDFWRRLVNSKTNGVRNVDEVLEGTGLSVVSALRGWSVAVVVDDLPGGTGPQAQPSWNFLSAFPAAGYTEWLAPTAIVAGSNLQTLIRGGSSAYARFATAAGQEALIQAAAPGGTSIIGMRYTIVRIK